MGLQYNELPSVKLRRQAQVARHIKRSYETLDRLMIPQELRNRLAENIRDVLMYLEEKYTISRNRDFTK